MVPGLCRHRATARLEARQRVRQLTDRHEPATVLLFVLGSSKLPLLVECPGFLDPVMWSTGSTRSISTGKTCKTLVVSILVPQERLWVDDLPASANLG